MVNIEFVLLGKSPLLCHNPRMVDPEYEVNRQIKLFTSKKKKTDDDLKQIERLEWLGGIYTASVNGNGIVVSQPCSKVRKCLINTGKINKLGKQVERALLMTKQDVALIYDGSDKVNNLDDEIARLMANPAFASRLSVGIRGKRVMRVRPQFFPWALVVPAVFIPDAGLDFDELVKIVELAGQTERIGDNRVNGYGAFRGHVRKTRDSDATIGNSIADVREFFEQMEQQA